jgi:hypothetical protein
VEVAVGEWVKFLFQDDLLEEDCIEKFVSHANDGVNLIVSQRSYFFSGDVDRRLERYYRKGVRTFESLRVRTNNSQISGPVISRLAVRNMGLNFIAEPSLVMVRRSVFSELGAFNTDLAQICDLEFMLRVASKYGLTLIPEELCHFRVHPQSVSLSHVEGRPYLLRHLDPIVLAWSFLFADHFAELRKSLDDAQLRRLKKYFDVRCYEAALVAAESPRAAVALDGIAQKFPEIGKGRGGSPATRMLFRLVRARRLLRHIYVSCRYLWP